MDDEKYDGREGRGGDLVLAQGEMALVQDGANGNVDVIVGPYLHSLSKSDNPVAYEAVEGRFKKCSVSEAIELWPSAKEGQYIVLENPADENWEKHPEKGKIKSIELGIGRRVNIPGPIAFALFPGQSAEVIGGHILRTNQYLLVRVTNGEAAMKNWEQAILKPQTTPNDDTTIITKDVETGEIKPVEIGTEVPSLVTGQLLIVKGTEVSFYIPPTGIEVVAEKSEYVRDAVTLEQLEYCILLDESGTKEYVRGPDVVFPKPTQVFCMDVKGSKKFRAIELNDLMGIYLKVIVPYLDDGKEFKEGVELFITGNEQKIYWPRVEHSIIKYGDKDIYYAIAIPKGEARYVLNRDTGDVYLVRGPKMFLPDPRKEVIVRRVLSSDLVELLYPKNKEAADHNSKYRSMQQTSGQFDESLRATLATESVGINFLFDKAASDSFERKETFTPPRTIQLDTKYDGAVRISVWTGYAVKIVNMTGDSRIVVGPTTTFLEYDETPEVFELSTGTPKSDEYVRKDVYLRVKANKVSDSITQGETSDFINIEVPISYRVNFEGAEDKWFDVENYVKFLTDHLRSLVANTIKQYGIDEFSSNYIDIIRDAILGASIDNSREGRTFEENGMRIYDVELGRLLIGNAEIGEILEQNQRESVTQTLSINMARKNLKIVKEREKIEQSIETAEAETKYKSIAIEERATKEGLKLVMADIATTKAEQAATAVVQLAEEETLNTIHGSKLLRRKEEESQTESHISAMSNIEVGKITNQVKAITPGMIEALQLFGNKEFAAKLANSMGPLAVLGGTSIADVFNKLIKGTFLESKIDKLLDGVKREE